MTAFDAGYHRGTRELRRARLQVSSTDRPDRPVPVLIGNGQLVTTLNRYGYHSPIRGEDTRVTATQSFVMAGHRLEGARHPLIDFGVISRTLNYPGSDAKETIQEQILHLDLGEVRSKTLKGPILESTRTLIALQRNLFLVETTLTNQSSDALPVNFEIDYRLTDRRGRSNPGLHISEGLNFETHDNLGKITFHSDGPGDVHIGSDGAEALHFWNLAASETITVRTWISFSSRIAFQLDVDANGLDEVLRRHRADWRAFWARSSVETGDPDVDRFRSISLYTIRCQTTPWSIPPTVSKPYWDAGTFHDEMYPFLALLSGGHKELARHVPYYRLTTLPKAIERAMGRGALFPWSATETGEERDPHGHWYTERFHLGQIAASAWWLWLYSEDLNELDDLYPLVRELARYFEHHLLEEVGGRLRTKPCTDFDESVGEVAGGPMTMGAAIFCLERAAEAARRLGKDRDRCRKWERLAHRLRDSVAVDTTAKQYVIPGGVPQHSSVAGLIMPFAVDTTSEFAKNTVRFIHAAAKSHHGWKPGFNDGFEDTSWMWTAGHLGMCHSALGDGAGAWECVRTSVEAAGQFLSPNERLNAKGEPIVPWFTTGCGAWLTALHWMFVRVDDGGMHILPAIPKSMTDFKVRGLAGIAGITVDVEMEKGKLVCLAFHSEVPQPVAFEIPKSLVSEEALASLGDLDDFVDKWRFRVSLQPGDNTLISRSVHTTADTAAANHPA